MFWISTTSKMRLLARLGYFDYTNVKAHFTQPKNPRQSN